MVALLLAAICWSFSVGSGAASGESGQIREIPVSVQAGEQTGASVSGGRVVFLDGAAPGGPSLSWLDVAGGTSGALPLPAGIVAGPDANAGGIVWQDGTLQACLALPPEEALCQALPQASAMALSGNRAVTSHEGKIIRLVNFETMRSRILDSSTSSGGRFDPAVDGDQAVWVRERGYAGQYYEPLIASYDLLTDTLIHVTKTGGGATPEGESVYERRHPAVDGGRIFYQQRQRGPGNQWDIYEAVPDSFGAVAVSAPGDQVHPALSGNRLVYQDNRGGHLDEQGQWVGEWDIYLKDLDTGEETAVCTAPGDQVNPAIDGDLIVWQDNRSGDWDIYGARLTAPAEPPLLALSAGPAYWRNYENYLAHLLSVRYRVTNRGAGPAADVLLGGVVTTPDSVALSTGIPTPVAAGIEPGGSAAFELDFQLPPELRRFRTALYMSCSDAAGGTIWFPSAPPTS